MPATSVAQQHYMGMELNKMRHGQKTDVHMSEKQLRDYAGTKTKGLPMKAKAKSKKLKGAAGGIALQSSGGTPDIVDAAGNGVSGMSMPGKAASSGVALASTGGTGGSGINMAPPTIMAAPTATASQSRSASQAARGPSMFPFAAGRGVSRNGQAAALGTQGAPAYAAPNWANQLAAIYGQMYGGSGANIRTGLDQMARR